MLFDHADAFSNRPTAPFPLDFGATATRTHSIITLPYGTLWRTLRCSLTADILHPTRLGLLEPLQRDAIRGLVADLGDAAGQVVVVRDSLRRAMYALMAHLCFGDDGVDAGDVGAVYRAQLEFFAAYAGAKAVEGSRLPRLLYWRRWLRFQAAFDRVSELVITLIAARRRVLLAQRGCGGGGGGGGMLPYVDSLLNLRVPDGGDERVNARRMLTDKEMAPLVWEFIVAGTETVVICVEWALAHLVAQPEVQNKLHREVAGVEREGFVPEENLRSMPYLRAVVLECLRLHPPVPFILREAGTHQGAAVGIGGGAAVPASGMTTTLFRLRASEIGRNREAWTDPDEFLPDRFVAGGEGEGVGPVPGPKVEIKMMPFGAGRRYCPGAGLGMVHIGCVLAALVREFEWAPPAEGGGGGVVVDLTELDVFFKVMKTPLRARIPPRRRS
ncbi:Cytochrome P450 89A9 [Dichanthelium oligosanthes]|uniref:Cytochrome P450 89A9 n=1 Tax=Dichanthelium oligosanthes TaxID=888268 RepID=A0A1E5VUB6_9POAL|nr:Cytochrome P450 89A9 [Dichanthelium oligosanthes]